MWRTAVFGRQSVVGQNDNLKLFLRKNNLYTSTSTKHDLIDIRFSNY